MVYRTQLAYYPADRWSIASVSVRRLLAHRLLFTGCGVPVLMPALRRASVTYRQCQFLRVRLDLVAMRPEHGKPVII